MCSWSYQLDLAITNQIPLTQELGLMSLYCKYKYKPLAGLVVLLAKPKTGTVIINARLTMRVGYIMKGEERMTIALQGQL